MNRSVKSLLIANAMMAGASRERAKRWLSLARDAKRENFCDLARSRVEYARQEWHAYLRYLQAARGAL